MQQQQPVHLPEVQYGRPMTGGEPQFPSSQPQQQQQQMSSQQQHQIPSHQPVTPIKQVYDPMTSDAAVSGKTIAEGKPVVLVTAVPPSSATSAPGTKAAVQQTTTTTTTSGDASSATHQHQQQHAEATGVRPPVVVARDEQQVPGKRRIFLARLARKDYEETLQRTRERLGRLRNVRPREVTRGLATKYRSWLPALLALLTALMLGSFLVREGSAMTRGREHLRSDSLSAAFQPLLMMPAYTGLPPLKASAAHLEHWSCVASSPQARSDAA